MSFAGAYSSFAELSRHQVAERDYRIRVHHGVTPFAIVAPHGGGIERGTARLAEAIATDEHTFYAFEGIKKKGDRILHIPSTKFDEPIALETVARVKTVITIHGALGEQPAAWFGGLDFALRARMREALVAAGFPAEDDPSPTRQGRSPGNICNRGQSGKGVQIELTTGMRKILFDRVGGPDDWEPNRLQGDFVAVLRECLRGP